MDTTSFTKDERSLLLFLETCAVDGSGAVKTVHMNAEDMAIARRWNEEGYLTFKRIHSSKLQIIKGATHWVELSSDAWNDAAALRKARAIRTKRDWLED